MRHQLTPEERARAHRNAKLTGLTPARLAARLKNLERTPSHQAAVRRERAERQRAAILRMREA